MDWIERVSKFVLRELKVLRESLPWNTQEHPESHPTKHELP